MNRTLSTLIPLAVTLCIAPFLTQAQANTTTTISNAECASAAHLTYVQARVVEKAEQGVVPLRQYIWRTRMIHQLDLRESVAWLDHRRALLAACEQRSAHIDLGAPQRSS